MQQSDKYIAIDIGGTYTKLGLVTGGGTILANKRFETRKCFDTHEFLIELNTAIASLLAETKNQTISGIGLGAPMANYHTGEIGSTANLNWKEPFNIQRYLTTAFDTKVAITNDANLAALGEKKFGKGKHLDHFVTVTLGTGVGSGIIINGRLFHSKHDLTGELGHMVVEKGGRQCGCGGRGCLETYVSANGIVRTAFEMMSLEGPLNTKLTQLSSQNLTAEHVAQLAVEGDIVAAKVFEQTGEKLGLALANIATFLAPEKIFLSGGPINAGEILLRPTLKAFKNNLLRNLQGSVSVETASLSANEISLLGAAALVMDDQNQLQETTTIR